MQAATPHLPPAAAAIDRGVPAPPSASAAAAAAAGGYVLGRASSAAESVAKAGANSSKASHELEPPLFGVHQPPSAGTGLPLVAGHSQATRRQVEVDVRTAARLESASSVTPANPATPSRAQAQAGGREENTAEGVRGEGGGEDSSRTPTLVRGGLTEREKRAIAAERRLAMLPR